MVKLNQNSLLSKFYLWFYETNVLPLNLCPYFWKLVAATLLTLAFGVPLFIIAIPGIIMNVIFKIKDGEYLFVNKYGTLFAGVIIIFMGVGVFSIISFLLLVFGVLPYDVNNPLSTFQILGGVLALFLIVLGVFKIIEYNSERRRYREKSSNIIVEVIKAKYNKYCPKIEWFNDNK